MATRRLPSHVSSLIAQAAQRHSIEIVEMFPDKDQQGRRPYGPRAVMRARRDVASVLIREGYSVGQISRWLRVHHTTLLYYFGGEKPAPLPADPNQPDLSGEWAI
jgi:hypothetical protein